MRSPRRGRSEPRRPTVRATSPNRSRRQRALRRAASPRRCPALAAAAHAPQRKHLGLFGGGFQPAVGTQLRIGAVILLFAGALTADGFFTSWAAFPSDGTMAVAYLQFHWKFAGAAALLPWVNKGELAHVYAFVCLYMASRGDGAWSLGGDRRAS